MHKKILLFLTLGVLTIATLSAAVFWTPDRTARKEKTPDYAGRKEKVPAQRMPKAPAKPPVLSAADAEYLFRRILLRQQDDYMRNLSIGRCGTRWSWLAEDLRSTAPKARLFAKAYPELAQRLALEVLEDPETPSTDREFVYQVLHAMPDWTTDRLEELLRAEVEAIDEWYYGAFALSVLGERDRAMHHRDLYQQQCRIGNPVAFEILSLSPHASSTSLFEELSRKRSNRHYGSAKRALSYLRIFESPDWSDVVEARIRKPTEDEYGGENHRDFQWALGVARQRELPFLLDALAERGRRNQPFDPGNDLSSIALSIFAEMDGELTLDEFALLRPNGFCGDPEARLLEIAATERLR